MQEKGIWRTVSGRRLFIKEGESLENAMKRSGKFKNIITKSLDKKINEKTDELLDKAKKHEQQISKEMKEVIKQTNGELGGYEFRLKTKDSLKDKIKNDYIKDPTKTVNQVSDRQYDTLRYTYLYKPDDLTNNYFKANSALVQKGYKCLRVKNTLKDTGVMYRGINTIYEKDGYKFELQFHTQESFDYKNGEGHKLYEIWRDRKNIYSSKQKDEAERKSIEANNRIETPKNVEQIKQYNFLSE